MKFLVCLLCIAVSYVAADHYISPKGEDFGDGIDKKKIDPSFAVSATNFDTVTLTNVLSVVTAAYSAGSSSQNYTENVANELQSLYPQFNWSGLYNTLAFYVSNSLYAEIQINSRDVLFIHAISNICY